MMLLYGSSEVEQLRLLQKQPNFRPCHYYGFVHLLRFLVLLPELLSHLLPLGTNGRVLQSLDHIFKTLIKFIMLNIKKLSAGAQYTPCTTALTLLGKPSASIPAPT